MRRISWWAATAMVLAPAAGFAQQQSAVPSTFTPAQRAEIVAIVRDALARDPSILRDAVSSLQADEHRRQAAAAGSAIAGAGAALTADPLDPVAGNPAGDVTVVEFLDPRCPYCRRMLPTLAQLIAADRGVRLVLKDIPILGPASVLESRALLAAQRQDGYLRLQAALMALPPDATQETIRQAAATAGLDWTKLQRDMDDPAISHRLDANIALAERLGVEGTPALVIGSRIIPGAVELAELEGALRTVRGR